MHHFFDTHELVKSFIKSGIKEAQAEVIIRAIFSSRDADMNHLASKADIAEVRTEIAETRSELKGEIAEVRTEIAEVRTEIAETRSELKAEIAEVRVEIHKAKNQLLTWFISIMIGTAVTYIGTIAALAFWFFEHYLVK